MDLTVTVRQAELLPVCAPPESRSSDLAQHLKNTLDIRLWAAGSYFRSPKTTFGRAPTLSGLTSGRPLTSVALRGGLLATTQRFRTLRAADGRFRSNRKWKYGGNRVNELAIHDFLFDFNRIYAPNCHRLAARNYFRSVWHRKLRNQTSFNVQDDPNALQWAGGSYFRSPKTTSGRVITISGFRSGRLLTSAALCVGLLATTQRNTRFWGRKQAADSRLRSNRK